MAKKSYYKKVLSIIRKEYPDMDYNDSQEYASRINKYVQDSGNDDNLDVTVKVYVGSEINSSGILK